MAKISIACRLPHGLILRHPDPSITNTVTLNRCNIPSKNSGQMMEIKDYSLTEVDDSFWEAWYKVYKDSKLFKSGAIFVAKNNIEATSIFNEKKDLKIGFAQANPDDYNVASL